MFVWGDRIVSSSTSVTGKTQIGYLLSSWLYMNTNCWDNVMFDNVSLDNSIGGFFITTPLTMLLIPSIINAFKSKSEVRNSICHLKNYAVNYCH